MGFGYLLIGYLITFVLYLSVQAMGLGGLALLLGYAAMLLGLIQLVHYQGAFVYAKWLCLPSMAVALYLSVQNLDELLLWNLPIFVKPVLDAVTVGAFLLSVVFQFAMLYGVREIAKGVGLYHIATKSVRNSIFVGIYAVLYVLTNVVFAQNPDMRQYFAFAMMLSELVCVLFNLFLLLSCTKNICAEGEEEAAPQKNRGVLGKIDEVFDRTRQKNIDRARASGEAFAQRRREKKEQKRNKKQK